MPCNGAGPKGLRCSAEATGQLKPSGNGRSPWTKQSRSMATAEHREPYESRGSRTVLRAPGGESPPGDSTCRRWRCRCHRLPGDGLVQCAVRQWQQRGQTGDGDILGARPKVFDQRVALSCVDSLSASEMPHIVAFAQELRDRE